jgi:AcrR family transcriptional regulator
VFARNHFVNTLLPVQSLEQRRRRLDQRSVLDAAERLVDLHGWDALSMTVLAEDLRTGVSSLYNHVANLQDLRAVLQVRWMGTLSTHLRSAAMGCARTDGVLQMGYALRGFAAEHPHRYVAITRAPLDPDGFAGAAAGAYEALTVMLRSCGVAEELLLQTCMAVFSAVTGFVSLEVNGFFANAGDLDAVYEHVLRGVVLAVEDHPDQSTRGDR